MPRTLLHDQQYLLQCGRSRDDVWRVTSFTCEKCRLKELTNMILVSIHRALEGVCRRWRMCPFRVYASKGCGALSPVDLGLDLSRQ